jgi:hypothetical protein
MSLKKLFDLTGRVALVTGGSRGLARRSPRAGEMGARGDHGAQAGGLDRAPDGWESNRSDRLRHVRCRRDPAWSKAIAGWADSSRQQCGYQHGANG